MNPDPNQQRSAGVAVRRGLAHVLLWDVVIGSALLALVLEDQLGEGEGSGAARRRQRSEWARRIGDQIFNISIVAVGLLGLLESLPLYLLMTNTLGTNEPWQTVLGTAPVVAGAGGMLTAYMVRGRWGSTPDQVLARLSRPWRMRAYSATLACLFMAALVVLVGV